MTVCQPSSPFSAKVAKQRDQRNGRDGQAIPHLKRLIIRGAYNGPVAVPKRKRLFSNVQQESDQLGKNDGCSPADETSPHYVTQK